MIRYTIQGLFQGQWTTIFSPLTREVAAAKYAQLRKTNPACKYRIRWFSTGEPITAKDCAS